MMFIFSSKYCNSGIKKCNKHYSVMQIGWYNYLFRIVSMDVVSKQKTLFCSAETMMCRREWRWRNHISQGIRENKPWTFCLVQIKSNLFASTSTGNNAWCNTNNNSNITDRPTAKCAMHVNIVFMCLSLMLLYLSSSQLDMLLCINFN